jgi:tetratricopeptide (TPR) repeat protein
LGISLALFVASVELWWPVGVAHAGVLPVATITDVEQLLEKRLDLYSKRADDLERLLSLLIAISTVYAIALSWNAYQQAEKSEDKLEKIKTETETIRQRAKEEAEKVRDDVLKIFPVFEGMDDAIRSTMHKLISLLPRIDLSEKKFDNLESRDKEEILFYEKTMSASEYFNLRSFKKTTSEIYHGLGNFYALKSASQRDSNLAASTEDRERSRFYLEKALNLDENNVGALNDRGYLSFRLDSPVRLEEAGVYYERSLRADADQQRAKYNLALVRHRSTPPDYEASIRLLTEALDTRRWQEIPDPRRISDILYNRACSRARLAEGKSVQDRLSLLNEAMTDLKQAFARKDIDWPSVGNSFLQDLQSGNDLDSLTKEPQLEQDIAELRDRVSSNLR